IERRPPSLATITKQRELRYCKNVPACFLNRAVHLTGFVFEDPQFDDPARQQFRIFGGVFLLDAQQNENAWSYARVFFRIDHDARLRYPLDYYSHVAESISG